MNETFEPDCWIESRETGFRAKIIRVMKTKTVAVDPHGREYAFKGTIKTSRDTLLQWGRRWGGLMLHQDEDRGERHIKYCDNKDRHRKARNIIEDFHSTYQRQEQNPRVIETLEAMAELAKAFNKLK